MSKRFYLGISISALAIAGALVAVFTGAFTSSPGATFGATPTGSEEVPPFNTIASGEAAFTLSADGASLTYKVTVSNISDVLASHIHLAPAGANGPIVAGLFAGAITGRFDGILAEGTITAANLQGPLLGMTMDRLVAEMKAGNTYVNVHTVARGAGEIRGQIRQIVP
ncbi:MAG: CHRD domain-containing protein [Chloroflexi bacterium]|nr:CHRD domain-containing protein [Chloroflexota bacterium]